MTAREAMTNVIKVGTKTTNTTLTCLTGFVLQWAKYGLKK